MTQKTKPQRRRERRRIQTRNAILNAAERVIVDRGYHGVTVEEIAELADVAVGSLYAYFGSKEGILEAVLERALAEDEASLSVAHTTSVDSSGRLSAVAEQVRSLHSRHPVLAALWFAAGSRAGGPPQDVARRIEARTRSELSRLSNAIAEAAEAGVVREVDPDLAATFLWAAWSGLTAMHVRKDGLALSDSRFHEVTEVGFRILSTGLLRRKRRPRER